MSIDKNIKTIVGIPVLNSMLKETKWMRICGNELSGKGDLTGVTDYTISDVCKTRDINFSNDATCGECGWKTHKPVITKKYDERLLIPNTRLKLYGEHVTPSIKEIESNDTVFIVGIETLEGYFSVFNYNKWYFKDGANKVPKEIFAMVSDECKSVGINRPNFLGAYVIKQKE